MLTKWRRAIAIKKVYNVSEIGNKMSEKNGNTHIAMTKWIHAQSFLDGMCIETALARDVIEYQEWKEIIYLCYKNDCRRHIAQLDPAFHQRRVETKIMQRQQTHTHSRERRRKKWYLQWKTKQQREEEKNEVELCTPWLKDSKENMFSVSSQLYWDRLLRKKSMWYSFVRTLTLNTTCEQTKRIHYGFTKWSKWTE